MPYIDRVSSQGKILKQILSPAAVRTHHHHRSTATETESSLFVSQHILRAGSSSLASRSVEIGLVEPLLSVRGAKIGLLCHTYTVKI